MDFISTLKVSEKTTVITWYKNNTVVRESSEFNITFDGTTTRLTISKCKVSHSATYKVVAKNEFGEGESTAVLTVTEKKEKKKEEEEEEEEERKVKKIEKKEEEKKAEVKVNCHKVVFIMYNKELF